MSVRYCSRLWSKVLNHGGGIDYQRGSRLLPSKKENVQPKFFAIIQSSAHWFNIAHTVVQ